MEHDKLVEVIRTVIENRQDPGASHRLEDYDLDAIATEAHEQTVAAGADELDPEKYWNIVDKHFKG
ncbi:MAG: hypothetical protein ACTH6N_04060 [Brachybacterium tyrofermentans]|uniref:hypothetical protein n=1 Tax=Brachybacterium tyrofermentans TaxID=47848 RepID=UPI000A1AAC4D|nr:hypothetical protein [Brachybacterium tyrofermentans]SLN00456.1 hypothetical protein FM103_08100 [Corynebacterium xerosis]